MNVITLAIKCAFFLYDAFQMGQYAGDVPGIAQLSQSGIAGPIIGGVENIAGDLLFK